MEHKRNQMTTTQFFLPYIINFSILFALSMVIKNRLKLLYPSIYSHLFARSISEHNVKVSIQHLKFMLFHNYWKTISEPSLLLLLQLQRVSWLVMILFLTSFPLIVFNGGFLA
jgi:hypothetical protein